MLFVALAKVKGGTMEERITRRAQWQYPEGMRVMAEYWPIGGEYAVVIVAEADSIAPIMMAIASWDDVFDFTITPAVTAQEGLELAKQMMQG